MPKKQREWVCNLCTKVQIGKSGRIDFNRKFNGEPIGIMVKVCLPCLELYRSSEYQECRIMRQFILRQMLTWISASDLSEQEIKMCRHLGVKLPGE